MKRFTLVFDDETTVAFNEDYYGDLDLQEQKAPYPNTVEDSTVFGLLENWSQGDSWIGVLLFEKGEPISVAITEA